MAQTAPWQFRSSSSRAHPPQNTQPSVCRGNVHKKNAVFKSRPQIGRTPLVTSARITSHARPPASFIPRSPFISPATYNFIQSPLTEECALEEEPGSGIKLGKRRRRLSSISSQPEGVYSPIPQSKILQELMDIDNNSAHVHAQSPVAAMKARCAAEYDIKDTEADDNDDNRSRSVCAGHPKRNAIRSEVLAMISTMDDEISKEIDDRYQLLRTNTKRSNTVPRRSMSTPFVLSKQMSELNIRTPVPSSMPPPASAVFNHFNENSNVFDIERKPIARKRSWTCGRSAAVTDVIGHILNAIVVILLLVVYWNIVDVQWRK